MASQLPTSFTLSNGSIMPAVGFGTYRIRDNELIHKAVDSALGAGYRLFDTAAVYRNEMHLKNAFHSLLPKYGLERKDIFITTKISPDDHGSRENVENACQKSLNNLGLDYVDLYLIHFPGTARYASDDPINKQFRDKTWAGLEGLYKTGRAKAIGVSNFTVRHLKELKYSKYITHTFVPFVNQVEWHPYYFQQELLDFCKENNIQLQAYCSFGGTSSADKTLLRDGMVTGIAMTLGVTTAQLLLVWAVQQGVAVIPKSTNPQRIKENISLDFTIPEGELKALNSLQRNKKYAWDPTGVE